MRTMNQKRGSAIDCGTMNFVSVEAAVRLYPWTLSHERPFRGSGVT